MTRRGRKRARRNVDPDDLQVWSAPRLRVVRGRPTWRWDLPAGREGDGPRLGLVAFSLTGDKVVETRFGRYLSDRSKAGPDRAVVAVHAAWLRQFRGWARHLLSLPIDWSAPLYVRRGLWGRYSKVFLDDDRDPLEDRGYDRVTERRFEDGVSVLPVTPQPFGWMVQRPVGEALYRLPDDYLATFLEETQSTPTFILQGDRVRVGTHVDEYDGTEYPIYSTGADGEPVLDPDTIRVIERVDPRRLMAHPYGHPAFRHFRGAR